MRSKKIKETTTIRHNIIHVKIATTFLKQHQQYKPLTVSTSIITSTFNLATSILTIIDIYLQ